MAKRGRPRVIEGQVRELLGGLAGIGCFRKQAARHVGVRQRTNLTPTLLGGEGGRSRLNER